MNEYRTITGATKLIFATRAFDPPTNYILSLYSPGRIYADLPMLEEYQQLNTTCIVMTPSRNALTATT